MCYGVSFRVCLWCGVWGCLGVLVVVCSVTLVLVVVFCRRFVVCCRVFVNFWFFTGFWVWIADWISYYCGWLPRLWVLVCATLFLGFCVDC